MLERLYLEGALLLRAHLPRRIGTLKRYAQSSIQREKRRRKGNWRNQERKGDKPGDGARRKKRLVKLGIRVFEREKKELQEAKNEWSEW